MRVEAENAQAVIDRDNNDAFVRHALAVIAILRAIAILKSAAENVDQHWQLPAARFRGRPHVQIQAVLAHSVAAEPVVAASTLHAAGAELVRVSHIGPVLHRLRVLPAQVADGRRRERNSFETANTVFRRRRGFEHAVRGFDLIGGECRTSGEETEENGLVVSLHGITFQPPITIRGAASGMSANGSRRCL